MMLFGLKVSTFIKGRARLTILSFLLALLFLPTTVIAKEPISLKITPENAGVFYQNITQQFKATATFSDGSTADYTKNVSWAIVSNPHPGQTLSPAQVAVIDENGLATVKNNWGRVYVVAIYPKPPAPPPPPPPSLAGVYGILLKPERACDKNNLDLCLNEFICERVGGHWWSIDNTCHSSKFTLSFLPAIYFILNK